VTNALAIELRQDDSLPAMPPLRLDGRRALVTGAGRGLGLASAAALAMAGAEVVLVARTWLEIEAAAAKIQRSGGNARAASLDVTGLPVVSDWIAGEAVFDILVNNAGTNRPASFLETTVSDFDAVFRLNVRAVFFTAQAVARRMAAAGRRGSIINVSSQMGHVGAATRTVYCASKHAVEGMTKAMAAELGQYGIRVNTICPTFVETPMTRPFLQDQQFRSAILKKIKVGRLGQPEDVMGAILFLASDASALMTGAALMLDGGWTSTS
jgi:NAD(P)-dependent dehydrogenase (short-subunit alcohol dehydrogenase family)